MQAADRTALCKFKSRPTRPLRALRFLLTSGRESNVFSIPRLLALSFHRVVDHRRDPVNMEVMAVTNAPKSTSITLFLTVPFTFSSVTFYERFTTN
jgi:hypothetical protein